MSAGLTQTDYTVMLVLLLLLSAVGLVWLGAFLQKRGERAANAKDARAFGEGARAGAFGEGARAGEFDGLTEVAAGAGAPNAPARGAGPRFAGLGAAVPQSSAEQIVRRMEQSLSDLQRQLNLDLAQLQASMKAERQDLERHVARVRQMASDHKLALTLFELFDSLKALPKKSGEAQQIDRAWHAQVGIEPDEILLPEDESDPWKIYFKLSGVWYLLRVLDRKYSRIDYYEIALHDEDGRLLAELRARPDTARTKLDKEHVSSLHVGPWLSEFIALRLRMDHRLQRTLMEAASRDVESMRRSFRILPLGKKVETASD